MSAASFSSDAAQSLFEAAYATPALSLIKDCGKAGSSERIYSELGKMWAQTRKGLELLPPAQCHVPQEGPAEAPVACGGRSKRAEALRMEDHVARSGRSKRAEASR